MDKFLDYMKDYLKTELKKEGILPSTFDLGVYDAYKAGHTPNKTELLIQIMDNSEVEAYSTLEGEKVSSIPLQITVFEFQTKLNGVMTSAREVSIKLGAKVKEILNRLRETVINPNILRTRVMTTSPALPIQGGEKSYTTAIRCEFWVANPYREI
jgi:hypothetical protein